jgi:hypothetical protein
MTDLQVMRGQAQAWRDEMNSRWQQATGGALALSLYRSTGCGRISTPLNPVLGGPLKRKLMRR